MSINLPDIINKYKNNLVLYSKYDEDSYNRDYENNLKERDIINKEKEKECRENNKLDISRENKSNENKLNESKLNEKEKYLSSILVPLKNKKIDYNWSTQTQSPNITSSFDTKFSPRTDKLRKSLNNKLKDKDKSTPNLSFALHSLEKMELDNIEDPDFEGVQSMQSEITNEYIKNMNNNINNYESLNIFFEVELNKIFQLTSRLPLPNALRTQVCSALFDKVCDTAFHVYKPIVNILKNELFRSIYIDYDEHADLKESIEKSKIKDSIISNPNKGIFSKALGIFTDMAKESDDKINSQQSRRIRRANSVYSRNIEIEDIDEDDEDENSKTPSGFSRKGSIDAMNQLQPSFSRLHTMNYSLFNRNLNEESNKSIDLNQERNIHGFTTAKNNVFRSKVPFFADFSRLSSDNQKLEAKLAVFKRSNQHLSKYQELRAKAVEGKMKKQLEEFVAHLFRYWKDQTRRHVTLWRKIKVYIFGQELTMRDNFLSWRQVVYEEKERRIQESGEMQAIEQKADVDYDSDLEETCRNSLATQQSQNVEIQKLNSSVSELTRKLALAEAALESKVASNVHITQKLDQSSVYLVCIVNMAQRRLETMKSESNFILKGGLKDAKRLKLVDKESDSPLKLLHLEFIEAQNLLLNWLNSRIGNIPEFVDSDTAYLDNFGVDLNDGESFLILLRSIHKNADIITVDQYLKLDQYERATYLFNQFNSLHVNDGQIVTVQDIMRSKADLNCVLVYRLLKQDSFLLVHDDYFYGESTAFAEIGTLISDFKQGKISNYEMQERLVFLDTCLSRVENDIRIKSNIVMEGNKLYEAICGKIESLCNQIIGIHANGAELDLMMDNDEAGMNFTSVSIERIKDIFYNYDLTQSDPLQQTDQIQELLVANSSVLKRIFRYYVIKRGNDKSTTISSQEFMKFIHDSKIPAPRANLKISDIDEIFWLVNRVEDKTDSKFNHDPAVFEPDEEDFNNPSSVIAADEEDDLNNPNKELIPTEFVEALIRIADKKFSEGSLSQKFELLLSQNVFKYAAQMDPSSFRKSIGSEEMNDVFRRLQRPLKLIFAHYASKGTKLAYVTSMNPTDFVTLMKDTVCGPTFQTAQVKSILNCVQEIEVGEGESDMVYSEYLEAIACVCVYLDPNPYIPIHKKVSSFITKELVPPIIMKVKGLAKVNISENI